MLPYSTQTHLKQFSLQNLLLKILINILQSIKKVWQLALPIPLHLKAERNYRDFSTWELRKFGFRLLRYG